MRFNFKIFFLVTCTFIVSGTLRATNLEKCQAACGYGLNKCMDEFCEKGYKVGTEEYKACTGGCTYIPSLCEEKCKMEFTD
jgi:hypothetical protein